VVVLLTGNILVATKLLYVVLVSQMSARGKNHDI